MKNYQFYHIYPLGMLNQLEDNKGAKYSLSYIESFIPHLKSMNINALYLGPVFQSKYHGYDTIDFFKVDPRLGDEQTLVNLVHACHQEGIEVVLDCVFNHVSREHFAFKDCINHQWNSDYKDWFYLDFNGNTWHNDGFSYGTWDGHDELVKLNLNNPDVLDHLYSAIDYWMDTFHIDGLRFDAADVMDKAFLRNVATHCRKNKSDFYLVGEMVHGDYPNFLRETLFDSVTNYECYKGLYSSLNDANYHEIAYALNRQSGQSGLTNNYKLYNFVDNHDVNRVASSLNDQSHLYPLYIMLYTIKGYPSLYYKSELGATGSRSSTSDKALRMPFTHNEINSDCNLLKAIQKLSTIRKNHPGLSEGYYEKLSTDMQLIAYHSHHNGQRITTLINSSSRPVTIHPQISGHDVLNDEPIHNGPITVYPNWGRIIV